MANKNQGISGAITSLNPAFETITGRPRSELLGKSFKPIIHSKDLLKAMDFYQKVLRGKTVPCFELRILSKSGTYLNLEFSATPEICGGKVVGAIGIARDITERKRVEGRMLLQSQIIETMSEGIYLIRASDGIIIYANPRFEQMFGYKPGELLGMHVSIVNAPTEKSPKAVAAEIAKALKENGEWSGDVFNIKKDGTKFWCHANVSTFEHPEHGKVWISVHTDITAKKLIESELLKFRIGLERSNDVVFMTDTDGIITYVNPAFEKTYGYLKKEAIGKTPRIIKSGKLGKEIYQQFWSTLLAKNVIAGEIINKTKDGKFLTIDGSANPITDERGNIIGFLAIQRDITEKKREEEELKQKNEELEKFNKLAMGREMRMIELKRKIAKLEGKK